jgi:type II secretory pathway component PulF
MMSQYLDRLSVKSLKRAIILKTKLEALYQELQSVLNDGTPIENGVAVTKSGKPRRKMSAAARARMAAAAKARWKKAKAAGKYRL